MFGSSYRFGGIVKTSDAEGIVVGIAMDASVGWSYDIRTEEGKVRKRVPEHYIQEGELAEKPAAAYVQLQEGSGDHRRTSRLARKTRGY